MIRAIVTWLLVALLVTYEDNRKKPAASNWPHKTGGKKQAAENEAARMGTLIKKIQKILRIMVQTITLWAFSLHFPYALKRLRNLLE
jgi:hypothetical protein